MNKYIASFIATVVSASAFAANYYWNPSVAAGDWTNAVNWCSDSACTTPAAKGPGNGDAVYFDGTKITTPVVVTCNNETRFTTTINLTGADSGLTVTLNGANLTATCNLVSGSTLSFDEGSDISYANPATPAAGATLRIAGGSSFTYNGSLNIYGSTLEILDGSTVTVGTHFQTRAGTVIIDNAALICKYYVYNSNGGASTDTFIFKGANPVIKAGRGYFRALSNNAICNMNFEVPVGGFKEPPIQFFDTTCQLFGVSNSGTSYNVNVLPTSPALLSAQYTTDCPLAYGATGMARSFVKFDNALNAAGAAALRFTSADGATAATSDAAACAIYARLGTGAPAPAPANEYSKGVAVSSDIASAVLLSADRRVITASASVTALATTGSTRARLLQGDANSESALSEVASADISALGQFALSWTAPKNQLNTTYYFQVLLETLDANGEVVYTEKSPVKSCATKDSSTYTWKGGDGDWSDSANWRASDETDRLDYPNDANATVVFPKGSYTVTVDGAYNVGTFTANAAEADVRFVCEEDAAFEDSKITVNSTMAINASSLSKLTFSGIWFYVNATTDVGDGNRILFDGCKVRLARVNSNGAGETYFKDSTIEATSGLYLGGGGSQEVKTVTLDNSQMTCNDTIFAGNAIGGNFVFKGKSAKLLANGAGKYLYAYTKNANFGYEFEVPAGGYDEAPIQSCANKTVAAFNDTQSGAKHYFRILPTSPALLENGTHEYLLVDWKGKAAANCITEAKCDFTGVVNPSDHFVLSTDKMQLAISIKGAASADCLNVVGAPEAYGAPVPAYGMTFGHTANETVSFSIPSTTISADGLTCVYTGYVISNALDAATYTYASSGSAASFIYTHPASSAGQVVLLWARSYMLTVAPSSAVGGTVSNVSGSYAEGTEVVLSATPSAGFSFGGWVGDVGDADAMSTTITVTMDQVRNITAVFTTVRYVGEDGSDDSLGTSAESPLATIAEAVARSFDGDEIVILPGEYDLSGTILLDKGVTVHGSTGNPEDVIIHGGNKNNANVKYHMFTLNHPGAFLHSVTLQDGLASGNWYYGSAIFISDPGYDGSSKFQPGVGGTASNCVVRSCKDTGKFGGAPVWLNATDALATHLVITNNLATRQPDSTGSADGFVLTLKGGAMAKDCLIAGNRDTSDGSGSCVSVDAKSTLANVTVAKNSAVGANTTAGIHADAAGAKIINCVVAGNTCNAGTASQCCWSGTASAFQNCVFDLYAPNDSCYAGPEIGLADLGNGDYHPTAASKCVNFGVSYLGMSDKDIEGNDRVIGPAIDAGCYERDTSIFSVGCSPDATSGFAPLTVTFTPVVTGVEEGEQIRLYWDFDNDGEVDLTTANLDPVTYEYEAGIQSVSLSGENLATLREDHVTLVDLVKVGSKVLYVKQGNPDAAYPFDTEANAAADIPSALDAALPGATIKIFDGDYPVSAKLVINKEVTLTSESGNRDAVILRGRAKANQKNTVMELDAGPRALVHSLTIADGFSDGDVGGILVQSKGGTVSNCVITGCSTSWKFGMAGGAYVTGANSLVTHCVLSNNFGRAGYSDGASANGAAICLADGGRCAHSLITRNVASPSDSCDGIQPDHSTVQVNNGGILDFCTVVSNSACYVAGVSVASGARVRYCVIAGNRSAHADEFIVPGIANVGTNNATAEQVNRWSVWGSIGSYSPVESGDAANVANRDKYVCHQELAGYADKASCFVGCVTDAVSVNGSAVATMDTLYRDAANANFALLGIAAAKDAVSEAELSNAGIEMPACDLFGKPRLYGSRYDVGAIECQILDRTMIFLR